MKEIKEVPEQLIENFDAGHKPDDSEDSGDELGVKNISPRLKESINKDFALIEEETGLPVKSYDERIKSVKLEDVKELPENVDIGDARGVEKVLDELNKVMQENEDKLWEVSEGYQNERIEKEVQGENAKEIEEKKGNDEEIMKPNEETQNREEEAQQNKEEAPQIKEEVTQNREEEVTINKEEGTQNKEDIKEANVQIEEENKIREENLTKNQQIHQEEEEKQPTAREENKNEKSNEDQLFAELSKNEENQQRIIPEQKPQEELVKQGLPQTEITKQETHHEKKHVEFDNPLEKELVKHEPKNLEVDRTSTAIGNDIKKNDPFVGDKTKTFGEHYERTGFPAYPQNEKIKRDRNCFFCC